MSVRVMSLVWERDDLDPYEKLVLLAMADHADDDGRCYPSIRRLCERTGMKERGTRNVIVRLCDKGLLTVDYGAGRAGSNLYTVVTTPRTGCSTPAPDAPPSSGTPPAP
ncbi:helix-turn-helix domain-containing protein, partial [Mameliella sp. MMSF_3537]